MRTTDHGTALRQGESISLLTGKVTVAPANVKADPITDWYRTALAANDLRALGWSFHDGGSWL